MSWVLLQAWEHVKQLEGGFTVDEGGSTKFGVCWKWDKEYLIALGYSEDTVKDLTEKDAFHIFTNKYWFNHKFYLLEPLPLVCKHALDLDYHEGKYGWMSVQLTCNEVIKSNLTIDGACGPKTKQAVIDLINYSKVSELEALNDNSLCAILRKHKTILYTGIWLEELELSDPRATIKYNSALRRV